MFEGAKSAAVPLVVAALLGGCGATGGGGATVNASVDTPGAVPVSAPASRGPETVVKGRTPVQLYSHIAREIRACWFNPRAPLIKGYAFFAEAGAGGKSGTETNIAIHELAPGGRRGLKAFSIEFVNLRTSTRVVARNHKLPEALGNRFIAEVIYWAQGGTGCNGPS